MKLDILAIGVHPDDVELSCSGTLLHHIKKGYKVGICDLTAGELGTRGNAEIRLQEAENAKEKMGALIRENLHMADGFFTSDKENTIKLARVIRKYKPEIVLANAQADRHPDHGRAAKFIADTCFYSGLKKIEIQDGDQHLDQWRPKAVYHYIQDRNIKADFVVDITDCIDEKMELILTFKSQFYMEGDNGPQTPISSKNFMDFIRAKNKAYGRDIGVEYAEAFNVNRNIGVKDLFDLL